MPDTFLPQTPFDGQIYFDYARQTRWVYSKSLDLWERQGIAEPPSPANENSVGTLDKVDKAFIDTIQTNTPGSFSIIVDPKTGLITEAGDNLITGNIKLVSDSLDINCTLFTPQSRPPESTVNCEPASIDLVPDGPVPPALNFSLSTNFLNSLVIDLPGPRGDTGPKGIQGTPGRHGFDFVGPVGETGRPGVNGTTVYTLEGILYEDFPEEISDTAVVDIALEDFDQGGKQLVYTKGQMDLTNDAANRVAATMLQRYIEYPVPDSDCNNLKLSDWILRQPPGDSTRLDLNIVRLPTGADKTEQESVQFDASMTLTDLIESVVKVYQDSLNAMDEELGQRARDYIEAIDNDARQILADLAGRLSGSEFSLPSQDFCVTFSSCEEPIEYPTPEAPPKPTPTPIVPSPVVPDPPPPYTPTPTVPPLPPTPPTPTGDPPFHPPTPPESPTPVFPPSPRPPTPVVPPPPTPSPQPPTPVTPTPSPSPVRSAVFSPPGTNNVAGGGNNGPMAVARNAPRPVTLNNRNWFYLT